MRLKHILPLLLITLAFTACVEKTETTVDSQTTIAPDFSIDREDLESKILTIIPAEDILISSGKTKKSGEEAYNFISVEIVSSDSSPSSGITFSSLANEVAKTVEEDINNIKDFQKVMVEVHDSVEEENSEYTITYKKELEL